MTVTIIEKEAIHDLTFPHKDLNNIEKKALLDECEKAMKLGNGYKSKCKIYFEDNEGIKMVEIIPGKGSGQLKKKVIRFLDQKEIKQQYHRVEKDSKNFGRLFVHFKH